MEHVTQEKLKELFIYEEGKLIWKTRSSIYSNAVIGNPIGVKGKDGYLIAGVLGKGYRVHRLIFLYHYGYLPEIVDHKDCNVENNKIENLRAATYQQSNLNRRIPKINKCGVKGVYKNKSKTSPYVAAIKFNNKQLHLGSFATIEEAEQVVKRFREQNHGDFINHG